MGSDMNIQQLEQDGYCITQLESKKTLNELQEHLLGLTRLLLGKKIRSITDIHTLTGSWTLSQHRDFHAMIFKDANLSGYINTLVLENQNIFCRFFGTDLCISTTKTLRIVRPNTSSDYLGAHRDTDLGHTPFEIKQWLPLCPIGKNNGLQIFPMSHRGDQLSVRGGHYIDKYVVKGSRDNRLGFMYKPLAYELSPFSPLVPNIRYGEILSFVTPLLHGGAGNTSSETRWSVDFALSNSYYPIEWTHHGNEPKFENLKKSFLTRLNAEFSQR
jgi:hypothetical protein